MTVPVMFAWRVQRYANVPAVVNWKLNVPFCGTLFEFQRPVFDVVVCASLSLLVQTTVDPTVVVRVAGLKLPPTPVPVIATAVPVPVVGGGLGLLSFPHPATTSARQSRSRVCRIYRQCQPEWLPSRRRSGCRVSLPIAVSAEVTSGA